MTLSIVIVNYNVKDLLYNCLKSIYNNSENINVEIFVVDNNSSDHSIQMVEQHFPEVITIKNSKNVGFSTANNQAIKLCKNELILLLNPDTIIKPNTLNECIQFMKKNQNCGALSVLMKNGKGDFLPESKRGFPSPIVSFFRLFKFHKLFPQSAFFNQYYLGHLDKYSRHEIDVLCGAFFLSRKKVFDTVGLLDESFFMYGEDIDLSYRIKKSGYSIFYLGDLEIIHFKGESTNKFDYGYIDRFYGAMKIFSKKHYPKSALLYLPIINLIILISYFKLFIGRQRRK